MIICGVSIVAVVVILGLENLALLREPSPLVLARVDQADGPKHGLVVLVALPELGADRRISLVSGHLVKDTQISGVLLRAELLLNLLQESELILG